MADLKLLAQELVMTLSKRGLKITVAESCTGGLIAAAITDTSGASAVFDVGYVTYANHAKVELLGVTGMTLASLGAVSKEVAEQMAKGALEAARADIAISVTGIAGPSGGSHEKPVGLVYIGIATGKKADVTKFNFKGNREEIRAQAVQNALELVMKELKA